MKFFKAKVTVESEVEFGIQAEDESSAQEKAKKIVLEQFSEKSRVSQINLALISESAFQVGSKVRHKVFGVGTVKNLVAGDDSGWRTTIKFEENGEKDIVTMPGKQFVEPVNV